MGFLKVTGVTPTPLPPLCPGWQPASLSHFFILIGAITALIQIQVSLSTPSYTRYRTGLSWGCRLLPNCSEKNSWPSKLSGIHFSSDLGHYKYLILKIFTTSNPWRHRPCWEDLPPLSWLSSSLNCQQLWPLAVPRAFNCYLLFFKAIILRAGKP